MTYWRCSMTYDEWKIKELEKELSDKEGYLVKVISVKGNEITICSQYAYDYMISNRY